MNENWCCEVFTESLYLDVQKNTILKRLYLLVRMLNIIKDDNEENLYVISTNFIRKLTEFFTIICEKESSNVLLTKIYSFKNAK